MGGRGKWGTLLEASDWTPRCNRNKYGVRFTFVTLHGMVVVTPNLQGLNHILRPLSCQGVLKIKHKCSKLLVISY